MTTRRPGVRAFRPAPEGLEGRQLLAKVVTGVDLSGDTWTLRLEGPGDLRVTNQNDSQGNPIALGLPAEINTIEVAGAAPLVTRLVGTVKKGANSDGRVFFQDLNVIGSRSAANANGFSSIHAIDMPDFWLGHTSTTAPASGFPATAGSITIPDGVNTLRFGGVDATFTVPGGQRLSTITGGSDFTINLGLPKSVGTSIIANRIISDASPATSSSTSAIQVGVVITVQGRINLFQANEVDGNAAVPSSGYAPISSGMVAGGTVISATADAISTATGTGINGQIGFIRVGGNATNFSTQSISSVANYYVGGETNNVFLITPAGARNVYFGQGMDTTTIHAGEVFSLHANRGAIGSSVIATTAIGQVVIGGDVVDTSVVAGYSQNVATELSNQTAPSANPNAQINGTMKSVLVAGNMMNSVFAASVEPSNGVFGSTQDLVLPHGKITAKLEGTIDNSTATPDSPGKAFYAQTVKLARGPVVPPNVVQQPFENGTISPKGPRIAKHLLPYDAALRQRLANRVGS